LEITADHLRLQSFPTRRSSDLASDVFAQSFSLDDVLYWIEAEPEFGKQAVYLIEPDSEAGFDNQDPATWDEDFEDLHARGVNYLDRKSTRLNSSHVKISYAVFC